MKAQMILTRITLPKLTVTLSVFSMLVFLTCKEKQLDHTSTLHDSVYIKAGNKVVALTSDSLVKSLLAAISTQGIEGAITFCNVNAADITQTYADTFLIRRTSLRYRNSDNGPDSLEQRILHQMSDEMETMKTSKSHLVRRGGSIHFFKPIILQGMCLSCHGKPQVEISSSTLKHLTHLYPNDQAVNFKEGDLRGMWHITFKPPGK